MFINVYAKVRMEMGSLLNIIALIGAGIIGFSMLCTVLYVIYNILAGRRELKIFALDSGDKK